MFSFSLTPNSQQEGQKELQNMMKMMKMWPSSRLREKDFETIQIFSFSHTPNPPLYLLFIKLLFLRTITLKNIYKILQAVMLKMLSHSVSIIFYIFIM